MEYSNTALVGHQDQPQDTLGELVAQVHQKKKFWAILFAPYVIIRPPFSTEEAVMS